LGSVSSTCESHHEKGKPPTKKSQKRNRQETSEIFLTDKDRKIQKSENDFVHDTVCIKLSIGIAEKKGHGNSCTS
jgi:hypothetical protein